MRLPTIDGQSHQIDENLSERLLKSGIERGVNYIDTAWPYHRDMRQPFEEGGMSEPFVGGFLKKGDRDKVFLATKLPSFFIKTRQEMDFYMNEQLKRLQTDYIDFYLVHNINQNFWNTLKNGGIFDFLDQIKKDGRARHVGFSFHDELPLFKEIIDAYPWEFCQIQFNYMDIKYQAGEEGLRYASGKGIGMVVMEPLKGGRLAVTPETMSRIWKVSGRDWSPAEWALRFLWNDPSVSCVLSGMNAMSQLDENIRVAGECEPGALTPEDQAVIKEAKAWIDQSLEADCTQCGYCMPCPSDVDIPLNLKFLNDLFLFGKTQALSNDYNFTPQKQRASACIECGACVEKCPQHIDIPVKLQRVKAQLG
jgi:predicted aldo/keto reductase-like oxidoreductase